jgi:hypothetical protein
MKHILWIDDMRDPNSKNWKEYLAYVAEEFLGVPLNECVVNWVKNKNEFIQHLIVEAWPDLICFDHDLGLGPTGYDCAKYLVDMCMETGNPLPEFTSQSSNPVGREDIICLLENYKKHAKLN